MGEVVLLNVSTVLFLVCPEVKLKSEVGDGHVSLMVKGNKYKPMQCPQMCVCVWCVCLSRAWLAAAGGLRPKGDVSRDLPHVRIGERRVGGSTEHSKDTLRRVRVQRLMRRRVRVCSSTISRSASALRDIPEAMDELPGIAAAEASG